MIDIQTEQLFDLKHTLASDLLSSHRYPWEILPLLKDFLSNLIATLPEGEYDAPSPLVRVATNAHVAENVMLIGPCVIGHNTELRTGAYVRGSVLVGDGCVVGNSCELKNTILFDGAQVPHFNYVGDSILGYRAHMGAGAITSNVKGDRTTVTIATDREKINTNLKKCAATGWRYCFSASVRML